LTAVNGGVRGCNQRRVLLSESHPAAAVLLTSRLMATPRPTPTPTSAGAWRIAITVLGSPKLIPQQRVAQNGRVPQFPTALVCVASNFFVREENVISRRNQPAAARRFLQQPAAVGMSTPRANVSNNLTDRRDAETMLIGKRAESGAYGVGTIAALFRQAKRTASTKERQCQGQADY